MLLCPLRLLMALRLKYGKPAPNTALLESARQFNARYEKTIDPRN